MKRLHSRIRRARDVPRIDEGAIDSGKSPSQPDPTESSGAAEASLAGPAGILGTDGLIGAATTDVGATRERVRQRRMLRLSLVLAPVATWLLVRALVLHRGALSIPHLPSSTHTYLPAIALIVVLVAVMVIPLVGAGRSPHVLFRPGETDVSLSDVRGARTVVEEVVKTLNLFLAHKTFGESMGGSPRRGVLFEGPPGTGKTYLAKAMASEAGVPFLFVSSSAFQSMFYGQTNRKIRSYFRMLRKYARLEGGAIGFIEEIDAIGASRSGMGSGHREGVAGVVNELLIQLQSFDTPPLGVKLHAVLTGFINLWLPAHLQMSKRTVPPANILVIGATNRASDLDPALLRPGRFDRSIYFDLPTRAGRRDIIDYYLGRKAHEPELDVEERRDTLAGITMGYSPAMIEHLLDEALVWALRRGGARLSWADLTHAKMTEEIGLAQETVYTTAERRLIATHEAGHATVAWLVGKSRKLEVLSIIKRKDALGLLAHAETEERFIRTTSEIKALIEIALGGMAAEELFFGESTSGVSGDLKGATELACQMIGAFGMGTTLSSRAAVEMPGAGNLPARVLADDDAAAEVEVLLRESKTRVRTMLDEHRHVIEALRDALIDRDELIGYEILDVIVHAIPPVVVPAT